VDLFTGVYVRQADDIVLDGNPPIRLRRAYRTKDARSRAFGIGTSHSYDLFLVGDADRLQYVELVLEDGARVRYIRTSPGTGYADAEFVHMSTPTKYYMSRLRWNGDGWDIELRDGSRYSFQDCSPHDRKRVPCGLIGYRDARGHRLRLTRDALGNLTRINGGWFRNVYLYHDAGYRVIRADTGIGPAMTTVHYSYDAPGRLIKTSWRHVSVWSVLSELLSSYYDRRLPSLRAMWLTYSKEYTYDEEHRMRTIKEPHIAITNHYDLAGRVSRQEVADWGTWTFQYTTDEKGRVTQTDMVNPDGLHTRTLYNSDGYPVRDTSSPERQNEQTTIYERTAGTNIVTRLTITCRAPDGAPVTVRATVGPTETDDAVRRRLLKGCAS
jgi:Domain of unknown function (DUF6531)